MEIPKTLKIGAHIYKILFPYNFKERWDYNGQCDSDMLEIRVAKDDPNGNERKESVILNTVVHEVLHAIDHGTGLEIFAGKEGEIKVEALAESLTQFLIDNGFIKVETH